jgi:hypothetical protein
MYTFKTTFCSKDPYLKHMGSQKPLNKQEVLEYVTLLMYQSNQHHFTEFTFLQVWEQTKSVISLFLYCIRMETTVLYFKLCAGKF